MRMAGFNNERVLKEAILISFAYGIFCIMFAVLLLLGVSAYKHAKGAARASLEGWETEW